MKVSAHRAFALLKELAYERVSCSEAEKKAAISELQGSVADISIAVASRVIGSDLSDDEHRAIVERYVNEAGSFNGN